MRSASRVAALLVGVSVMLVSGCQSEEALPQPERVILITIDTLRADHLGAYGYFQPTSPFLDQLADRSVVFERAYSSSSHTAPSHASLLTGLEPPQHRVLVNGERLGPIATTLPEVLRQAGFRTGAFTAVRFLQELDRGFDKFWSARRGAEARVILNQASRWLARKPPDQRVFAWVHLYDVHEWMKDTPISRPGRRWAKGPMALSQGGDWEEYLRRHGEVDGGEIGVDLLRDKINRYDGQIRGTDRALERFVGELGAQDGYQRTLIVITADHGEGMGNHGYVGHGRHIYEEQVRVPLIFHFASDEVSARRVDSAVRLIDVAPTVAELVGAQMPAPEFSWGSVSLVPHLRGKSGQATPPVFGFRRPADPNRLGRGWSPGNVFSMLHGGWRIIVDTQGALELYSLEDDPLETANLADEETEAAARMEQEARRAFDALWADGDPAETGGIEQRHRKELEALGYL